MTATLVLLDCGRRTTQLMPDALGGVSCKRRHHDLFTCSPASFARRAARALVPHRGYLYWAYVYRRTVHSVSHRLCASRRPRRLVWGVGPRIATSRRPALGQSRVCARLMDGPLERLALSRQRRDTHRRSQCCGGARESRCRTPSVTSSGVDARTDSPHLLVLQEDSRSRPVLALS